MIFSNFSLRTRVYAFFFALVLVSTFNFGMMIHLENQSIENYIKVNQTHEIIEMSGDFLSHVTDAETGQRGYLLTNNLDYLEPYYSGVNKANQLLRQLKAETVHNAMQQELLVKIEYLMNEKFLELKETIELNSAEDKNRAIEVVTTDIGKNLMDKIRSELVVFNQEERKLLKKRHIRLITLQERIRIIFIVESIAFAVVLTLLGLIVSRTILSPINDICTSVKAFEIDKSFVPVNVRSRDEIGVLANAFNFMGGKAVKAAATLIENKQAAEFERDKALVQSVSDPLTGLFNRRFMEVELTKLMSMSHRYHYDLSIIMVDIDHFKQVNDTYGHVVGDIVLKKLAALISREIRGSDLAIRYGGEEFTLILANTAISGAKVKAEEIRQQVAKLEIAELQGNFITVSLGLTALRAVDKTIEQLIERADTALYEAKNSGRDRFCIIT